MKHLKVYSEVFLWAGRIFIIGWFGLIVFRYLIPKPSNSLLGSYEAQLLLFVARNSLIIMSPFLLIIGHALRKIYLEFNKINNKLK